MNLGLNILRSRVTHRMFLLFFLAAFVPVALISYLSYGHINQQLAEDTRRQLYQTARGMGLATYDRMLILEDVLSNIAESHKSGVLDSTFWGKQTLNRMFDDIVLYHGGGHEIFMGNSIPLPELDERQERHLADGNATVAAVTVNGSHDLVMVTYLPGGGGDTDSPELLVGRPNSDYLWNFGIYVPEIACAFTSAETVLECSEPLAGDDVRSANAADGSDAGVISLTYNDTDYIAYVWGLFLAAQYATSDIGIMLAMPERMGLDNINSFRAIFPRALLITLLLVVLLSVTQIRRSLNPLEQLMSATRRITNGVFDKPVEIDSRDEFQALGDSFNTMAKRIDDQIQTLTMMAQIDHMILSSLDVDHITSVLLDYCHRIYPTDHIAVIGLDVETHEKNFITYNTDSSFNKKQTRQLDIREDDLLKIQMQSGQFRTRAGEGEAYLLPLMQAGDEYFLVFPLKVKLKLIGLLCLGDKSDFTADDFKLGQLRELADRAAVALSNAAWEEKLYQQAHYDALTGLPNRYLFNDRLEQALAWSNRGNGGIALFLIDLDRFKFINDSLGHTVGDELLVKASEILSSCVRATDTLSRFGGDEFTIILVGDGVGDEIFEQATHLARRLQMVFSGPIVVRDREIFITPSVGIATSPNDANNIDDLLKYADHAMYQAKADGRGQYRFYDQTHNTNVLEKLDLETDLRHALQNREIHLVYQPKIVCASGRIIGAEALVRWNHPKWGYIPQFELISLAEETGLILEIGAWVMQTACRQAREWLVRGVADLTIAVNVSGKQFRQHAFENVVAGILAETGLDPDRLELEITESVAIQNLQQTVDLLSRLHKLGVSVSIDDFGTGYSSMSYLQQFDVDRLKIDKSFIQQIPDNRQSISIVNAIIALAHSSNLLVTAEGVETREQFDYLLQTGIDELQGFYFSRPVPAGEFEDFMNTYEGDRSAPAGQPSLV